MTDRENKSYHKGMTRTLCNKGIKTISNKIHIHALWQSYICITCAYIHVQPKQQFYWIIYIYCLHNMIADCQVSFKDFLFISYMLSISLFTCISLSKTLFTSYWLYYMPQQLLYQQQVPPQQTGKTSSVYVE